MTVSFSTLGGQNVLVVDPSFTETMQHAVNENNGLEREYSTLVRTMLYTSQNTQNQNVRKHFQTNSIKH